MKVYTKTGDTGTTSLYDGSRKSKCDLIFDVVGTIDELSSHIGVLCTKTIDTEWKTALRGVQRMMYVINSNIATIDKERKETVQKVVDTDITLLESFIDTMEQTNPRLTKFILPGITPEDAQAHVCRSVSRRAERLLWSLHSTAINLHSIPTNLPKDYALVDETILKYMNRLSDFFFVLARYLCTSSGGVEAHV